MTGVPADGAAGRARDVAALDQVRTVADAVLYEGYLLYPYRSTSAKNQVRWQFGVLGPPAAASAGVGEEPDLAVQCLLAGSVGQLSVRVYLRFLQLQARGVQRANGPDPADGFTAVEVLTSAGQTWLSWDEAVERELVLGPFDLAAGLTYEQPVEVAGGEDVELLHHPGGLLVGRVTRRRQPLSALLTLSVQPVQPADRASPAALLRLSVGVRNVTSGSFTDRDAATARSFLGAHLLLVADGASFISVIDPPEWAREAAAGCVQRRCWPVLAGAGSETDVVLASPIILYDYPAVAPESAGALFDSTEIDEILTLRVMTLTDDEKAAARATDAHAAAIIDRCDQLSPEDLQRLHGILRNPRSDTGAFPPFATEQDAVPSAPPGRPDVDVPTWTTPPDSSVPVSDSDVPWWDPGADASVQPSTDSVLAQGIEVRRGSLVRLRPNRRADAQDLFFAGQDARVTAVLADVDGDTHVAVVLLNDPAAELHEWYGRYLYFAPEELEPLAASGIHDLVDDMTETRKES